MAPEPWAGWGRRLEVGIPSVGGRAGLRAAWQVGWPRHRPSVAPLPGQPGLLWVRRALHRGCAHEAAVTGDGPQPLLREHLIAAQLSPQKPSAHPHTAASGSILLPPPPPERRPGQLRACGGCPHLPLPGGLKASSPSPPRAGRLRLRRGGCSGQQGCARTEQGPSPPPPALRAWLGCCSSGLAVPEASPAPDGSG